MHLIWLRFFVLDVAVLRLRPRALPAERLSTLRGVPDHGR